MRALGRALEHAHPGSYTVSGNGPLMGGISMAAFELTFKPQVAGSNLAATDPLFKNRAPEAAARALASAFAWLTECHLTTLEQVLTNPRTTKDTLDRQVKICNDAVAKCRELDVPPSGLEGRKCVRLAEQLRMPPVRPQKPR